MSFLCHTKVGRGSAQLRQFLLPLSQSTNKWISISEEVCILYTDMTKLFNTNMVILGGRLVPGLESSTVLRCLSQVGGAYKTTHMVA